MSARNVNLTDHLSTFVDEQVRSGRHQNASEIDGPEENAGLLSRLTRRGPAA